jgi:hypothetical protein
MLRNLGKCSSTETSNLARSLSKVLSVKSQDSFGSSLRGTQLDGYFNKIKIEKAFSKLNGELTIDELLKLPFSELFTLPDECRYKLIRNIIIHRPKNNNYIESDAYSEIDFDISSNTNLFLEGLNDLLSHGFPFADFCNLSGLDQYLYINYKDLISLLHKNDIPFDKLIKIGHTGLWDLAKYHYELFQRKENSPEKLKLMEKINSIIDMHIIKSQDRFLTFGYPSRKI